MRPSDLELEIVEATTASHPIMQEKHGEIQVSTFAKKNKDQMDQFVSIEHADLVVEDLTAFEELAGHITSELKKMLTISKGKICIVGLGNHWMTADALGPRIIQKLQQQYTFLQQERVILLQPGVSLQSGMETTHYVKAIVESMKPSVVLAFDSLRAATQSRLCRFVQMTNAGIQPGSGILSKRQELHFRTLGVPVIAIGVPTVVSTLDVTHQQLDYALQHFLNRLEAKGTKNPLASVAYWQAEDKDLSSLAHVFGEWARMSTEERKQFIFENAGHTDRIVTPTNIHEWIERWSDLFVSVLLDVLAQPAPS